MSGGNDESLVERKAMDSKQPGAKLSSNILSRVFDNDRSVGSAKSGKPLLAQLFFQNASAKVAGPMGEASGSGDFPLFDGPWTLDLLTRNATCQRPQVVGP